VGRDLSHFIPKSNIPSRFASHGHSKRVVRALGSTGFLEISANKAAASRMAVAKGAK